MIRRASFAGGLVLFALALQFSAPDRLASIDGYFHIRYCALLREAGWSGFPPEFPWLPLTILAPDRYFDHHWLFHVLIAPFASGNLILRAKLIAAAGAALVFLACYGFLLWQRVRGAEYWTVALLAGAPGFLFRMEMPRVQSWSLLFLLAALALLLRRRARWLLPLAWTYTWLYDAFPLLLAICACACAAAALLERRFDHRLLAYPVAGIVLGLLINPYFPHDFTFIAHHYLAKLGGDSVPVGTEWYPLPVAEWFGTAGLLAIVLPILVLLYRHRERLGFEKLTMAFTALVFFALLWRSARFVEYFVPFAAFALASTFGSTMISWVGDRSPRLRQVGFVLLLGWFAVSAGIAAWKIRTRAEPFALANAAAWIALHSEPESLIFNADWDDFPLLYFHNVRNTYVIGLDPTYLARHDPERYTAWADAAAGGANPARAIRDRIRAVYAVSERKQEAFVRAMDSDPVAYRAYEDDRAIVYGLRPETP